MSELSDTLRSFAGDLDKDSAEKALRRSGLAPGEAKVTKATTAVTTYDIEGDVSISTKVVYDVVPVDPKWPVVQHAKPVVIKPAPSTPKKATDWDCVVVLPDPQFGFRRVGDELIPFHDPDALDVALQVTSFLQRQHGVSQVVLLGDYLDLPSQGKYVQEAAFSQTTQEAIDAGYLFLASLRASAPDAEIILLEGNHDRRMQNFITLNAKEAFGLKKAHQPTTWPVMSIPNLLRLDELGVKYIDAYPAGVHWINDKLRAIHGNKVRSNGSTASAYTNEMPHTSVIFGHIHRQEIQSKTTYDKSGSIKSMAISPGCLCRVDGAVPGVNGSTDSSGRPVTYWENWQQGVAIVWSKPEGDFHVEMIHIDNGKTLYRNHEFTTKVHALRTEH